MANFETTKTTRLRSFSLKEKGEGGEREVGGEAGERGGGGEGDWEREFEVELENFILQGM